MNVNEDYPNGGNTPIIDHKEVQKSMPYNYILIEQDEAFSPRFLKDEAEIKDEMKNIAMEVGTEKADNYIDQNVIIFNLNTGEEVLQKSMPYNYILIEQDEAFNPRFLKDEADVKDEMKNIAMEVGTEKADNYIDQNVIIFNLNTGKAVPFKFSLSLDVDVSLKD
ncbi:MAG: hypothetical protein ACOCP4_05645 [Candidatus Woesearchaeota archaeon]